MTTPGNSADSFAMPLDIVVTRVGVFDSDSGNLLAEWPVAQGDLRLTGNLRGKRTTGGRVEGVFAGHQTGKSGSQTHESSVVCSATVAGFEAKGKGRPNTRLRDLALSLAVAYRQQIAEDNGESIALDAIYDELAMDVKWRLIDRDALKKACLRGDKVIKTECYGAMLCATKVNGVEVGDTSVALVKEKGKFVFDADGIERYEGYPWLWVPGFYKVERWESFRPFTITIRSRRDSPPTAKSKSQGR